MEERARSVYCLLYCAMDIVLLVGTLFFSLGLDKIILQLINKSGPINLFSPTLITTIPGFSVALAQAKSVDIVGYELLLVISLILFGGQWWLGRLQKKSSTFYRWFYLGVALLFYLQVTFVGYSGGMMLVFFGFFQILFWTFMLSKLAVKKISFNRYLLANGILAGLVIMQLMQRVNYSLVWSLFVLLLLPLVYHLLPFKFLQNPGHLILSLFILKPGDLYWLAILGVITIVSIVISEKIDFKSKKNMERFLYRLYPLVMIIVVAFNPLYYWSPLDSVEEGFWLGWLERLLHQQIIYKDFMVYHPPLLLWGLKYFVVLMGVSVAKVKLYFHLLQILAFIIFYGVIRKLIPSNLGTTVVLVMVMAISTGIIKNNVEIRVALGLLPLLPLFEYFKDHKKRWLLIVGIAAGLSLLTSIEVGIVSLLAITIFIIISERLKAIKTLSYFLMGVLLIFAPVAIGLALGGALLPMIKEISFYIKAFTDGYFNLSADRLALSPLLEGRMINSFLGSTEMWWQGCQLVLVGSLLWGVSNYFKGGRKYPANSLFVVLSLMGVLLFRTALARSDWWHLLFPLLIAILLIGYLVQTTVKYSVLVFVGVLLLFGMVLNRDIFYNDFVNNQLLKLQSYGKIPGSSITYQSPRWGIAVDQSINIKDSDAIIAYIKNKPADIKLFAYPWMPEIYFLTDRQNTTSIDTPYGFFSNEYQRQMITDLQKDPKALVLYDPNKNFGGLTVNDLPLLNRYLLDHFLTIEKFGSVEVKEWTKKS